MIKVDNVRIRDLMALLAQIHLYHEAVDVSVDPEGRRVIINPVDFIPTENLNKVELKKKDIDDII